MKTKLLVISMCLFFGMALNTANAQNRAYQGWSYGTYWAPVYCDGQLVDYLEGGVLRIHWVYKYHPKKVFWEIDQLKGEVTSSMEPFETFKIRETDKTYLEDGWICECKYNLIGNMGSHYIGVIYLTYTYFPPDDEHPEGHYEWVLTGIGKTVCH